MPVVLERQSLLVPLLAMGAVIGGLLTGTRPELGLGLAAFILVVLLTLLHPVAHLVLLIIVTAIVPFELMNSYGIGGGSGAAGLLISDVLLLSGLARAGIVLVRDRYNAWEWVLVLAVAGFSVLVAIQLVHGVRAGWQLSTSGAEGRMLLGFAVALIALPLVRDPQTRAKLMTALLPAGLALGAFGLFQWLFGTSFASAGDFGVREGVALTSGGTGQLQGGIYGYPVAVVLGTAAILSGAIRSQLALRLTWVMVLLNASCLLVTFERTLWVVTIVGCAFVVARLPRGRRWRAVIGAPIGFAVGLSLVAVLMPSTFTTARERFLSIGQYGSDLSVAYRVRESGFVAREIDARPVAGSGLGAVIYWGRPREQVPADYASYAHNGFLWVAWKVGVPGAIVLFGLWGILIVRRRRPLGGPLFVSVVLGAQGALLALLIGNVTFPSVTAISSTPTVGLLFALCAAPRSETPWQSLDAAPAAR